MEWTCGPLFAPRRQSQSRPIPFDISINTRHKHHAPERVVVFPSQSAKALADESLLYISYYPTPR